MTAVDVDNILYGVLWMSHLCHHMQSMEGVRYVWGAFADPNKIYTLHVHKTTSRTPYLALSSSHVSKHPEHRVLIILEDNSCAYQGSGKPSPRRDWFSSVVLT